jgi:hypothetical protein
VSLVREEVFVSPQPSATHAPDPPKEDVMDLVPITTVFIFIHLCSFNFVLVPALPTISGPLSKAKIHCRFA